MFEKHIFICSNKRDPSSNKCSCGENGDQIRVEFSKLIHEYGMKDIVRANKCGCLDGCELGPVVVIYPDKIWYGNVSLEDVTEIFTSTILKNKIVRRLQINAKQWKNRK